MPCGSLPPGFRPLSCSTVSLSCLQMRIFSCGGLALSILSTRETLQNGFSDEDEKVVVLMVEHRAELLRVVVAIGAHQSGQAHHTPKNQNEFTTRVRRLGGPQTPPKQRAIPSGGAARLERELIASGHLPSCTPRLPSFRMPSGSVPVGVRPFSANTVSLSSLKTDMKHMRVTHSARTHTHSVRPHLPSLAPVRLTP